MYLYPSSVQVAVKRYNRLDRSFHDIGNVLNIPVKTTAESANVDGATRNQVDGIRSVCKC